MRSDTTTTPDELTDAASLADVVKLLRAIRDGINAGHAELLSTKRAAALCGMSEASWHRLRSAGRTPKPVRVASGLVRYRRADLMRWISDDCSPPLEK